MEGGIRADGPDVFVGRTLGGRYRLERQLGSGGFAVVYEAEHLELERPVAVKILRDTFADTEELRSRFGREARALAGLSHPNIVSVMDYGVHEETPYLVMELLPGRTLKALLSEGPVGAERAVGIVKQILRGVAFAHERGVLHRDLKPGNVFLQELPDTADHVKLLDFGFVKFVTAEAGNDGLPLTRAGTAFGTPSYMAPEQALQKEPDARVDVYAIGVLFFEMLVGQKPFAGDVGEQLRKKLRDDPPPLEEAAPEMWVAPELSTLLSKALARDPEERFATAEEFLAALDTLPERPLRARTEAPPAPVAAPGAATGARPFPTPVVLLAFILPGLVIVAACAGITASLLMGQPETTEATGEEPLDAIEMVFSEAEAADLDVPDPWESRETPEPLTELHLEVLGEGELDDDDVQRVRSLAAIYEDDGRPHALLGHIYAARGWRTDALGQYEAAHQVDPGVRGDRRMLANLVVMATHPTVGDRASEIVTRIYGPEALGAVEAALAQPGLPRPRAQRLEQLRGRLSR